ncbi:MAG: ABC transporter permease [Alkalispirochaeta sp.]
MSIFQKQDQQKHAGAVASAATTGADDAAKIGTGSAAAAEAIAGGETSGAVNEFQQPVEGVSLTKDAWRRLKKNWMAMAGLVIVIVYALLSITAPILPIHSFRYQISEHRDLPPSLTKTAGELWYERVETRMYALAERAGRSELNDDERAELAEITQRIAEETAEIEGKLVRVHDRRYLFGTDHLGRDLLSRIIYGGQISIAIGLIGTITSVLIGIVLGSVAGYVGGKTDYLIMRFVDVMYGLPYMLLVIIMMAIFGRNIFNLFLALSLVSWLVVARVVRGQIISLKNSEFVEAAKSMGASQGRIIFRHLIPNTAGIIIVFATLRIPAFIMQESFLSFLGLGISAPFASWGSLVSDAVERMNTAPWQLFFPAAAMTLFLFAMNFLGDGLRDAFDPHSKNQL